jgi:uncharacterized protein (TIGR02594 family)
MKMAPRQYRAYNLAKKEIGTKEIVGGQHNPKIVGWFEQVGHSWVDDDETPWCAAFLGSMLQDAGLPSTRKLNARSYLDWGQPIHLSAAQPGDVVVFWRTSPTSAFGHVGFFSGILPDGNIKVLGGNQGNAVSHAPYGKSRLLGVRRMPAHPDADPPESCWSRFFRSAVKGGTKIRNER